MNLAFCMIKALRSPIKYDRSLGKYNTDKFNKANCLEVLKLLVRFGADANGRQIYNDGSYSSYPLQYAISEKHPISVIQFLLDSGANPNLHSVDSYSPVESAYRNNDIPLINLLLDRGANGAELLPALVSKGDNDFIKRLIARGVQLRSNEGAEALRKAAESGKFDTVKLLVENGVNVNARDSRGITALSLAYDKGEMEIYNYLKTKGAVDFEPKQVVQPAAPAPSTTNVYVQPAPAQSSPAPAPVAPKTTVYTVSVYYLENNTRKFFPEVVQAASKSEAEREAERQWKSKNGWNNKLVFLEAVCN